MSLVKCAECNHLVSNKAGVCPHCGYEPHGDCRHCKHYESEYECSSGRCKATDNEYVRNDKRSCPALVKKGLFDMKGIEDYIAKG